MSTSTHGDLPSVHSTIRLKGHRDFENIQWFDVKFYPYTPPGEDPVFAVVGSRFCFVCRCVPDTIASDGTRSASTIEVLRRFENQKDQGHYNFNSVEWSQAENGDPLVCIAGASFQILVLNVRTQELVATLTGHGAEVVDLAVSPIDPTILASCGFDHAIRLWKLDSEHASRPLAAVFHGHGHREQLLTLAYHRRGKYLLSGGMDTKVCLWMIPDDLKKDRSSKEMVDEIRYPHFSTSEIHKGYVDCIEWFNDLIISSASEEHTINLWKIEGFDSAKPPPNRVPVPHLMTVGNGIVSKDGSQSRDRATQSAWGGKLQRIRQFDLRDGHDSFYMRFSLFNQLGSHPILVAGNTKSKISFWDLYDVENLSAKDPVTTTTTKTSARYVKTVKKTVEGPAAGPFHHFPVKASQEHVLPKYVTLFRQFAWSKDGQWCVAAGEFSIITIMRRWEEGIPPPMVAT